jgi:pimeloyl-ACP methyl ester carboxylesterase
MPHGRGMDSAIDHRDGFATVADGLRLHYRDYPGSTVRPAILCLPGLTRNARDFADFAYIFAPRFRVIALDFRGRGESDFDPQPERYNPLTYAGDVQQLLDQLGIAGAILVGTSLGGLVTMILATMAPHRVVAAILNDVGPELEQAGLARIKSFVGKDLRFKRWEEAGAAIAANNAHLPASYSSSDWSKAARRACREENGEIRFDYDMAIANVFSAANAGAKVDLWPMFSTLARKPLLLVRGEKSDLLSDATLERMIQAAPQARSVVVAGAGHAPTLTEPDATVAIDAFLGEVAP